MLTRGGKIIEPCNDLTGVIMPRRPLSLWICSKRIDTESEPSRQVFVRSQRYAFSAIR
jgi:hypothetical protein